MDLVCQSCTQQMRKLALFQTAGMAGKLQGTTTDNGFKQVQIGYLAVISNLDNLSSLVARYPKLAGKS